MLLYQKLMAGDGSRGAVSAPAGASALLHVCLP